MKRLMKPLMAIDWWLFAATVPILAASLATMHSFTGDSSFALHQLIWIAVSLAAFFGISRIDTRFLRSTWASVTLMVLAVALLSTLFLLGKISHGAQSWLSFGF